MTTETGATTKDDLALHTNLPGASVGRDIAQSNYETSELIAATKVTNAKVFNADGDKIGWLDEVVINKRTGQVAYVVLAAGGFLGIGERYHPLPWERLTYDEDKGGYNIDMDRASLEGAQHFDRAGINELDYDRFHQAGGAIGAGRAVESDRLVETDHLRESTGLRDEAGLEAAGGRPTGAF